MATPFKLTEDGWETQYQVNYLGHFYLTLMLLERLQAGDAPSRVVHISSISQVHAPAHGCYKIPCCTMCLGGWDDGRWPAKSGGCCAYDAMEDYSFSKLAQLVFSNELDRRVKASGGNLITTTVDPGISKHTHITKSSCCFNCVFNYSPMPFLMAPMLKSVPQLAASAVYAALSDDVKGGELVMNSNVLKPSSMNSFATNPRYGPPLWDKSVRDLGALGAQLPSVAPVAIGMERTPGKTAKVAPS
jgi:NAD(P)-dependent dehydrogenase (short-subunit alcohol dehydrogenase family)